MRTGRGREVMTIEERIAARYDELSPQAQKAADTILTCAGDLALYSSAELAQMSGVSRATLSRLYRALGFDSFTQVRDEARALRNRGAPLGGGVVGFSDHQAAEQRNLHRLLETLGDGRLDRAVRSISGARDLVIVGTRNSYPVALHLRQQLIQVRAAVRVAPEPGQTLAEDLIGVGPGDTIVLVGFRRRRADFGQQVDFCRHTGADLVLIADPTARRHAGEVTCWLECPLDSAGPFDSYAMAMSLVSLLANQVSAALGPQGRRRVGLVAAAYETLGELDLR